MTEKLCGMAREIRYLKENVRHLECKYLKYVEQIGSGLKSPKGWKIVI